MMAVMTAQPPLPMVPAADATPIGAAAALVEDADGGRVFIHGELCLVWDADDEAARRLAAVQLVAIKAASLVAVAAGFGVDQATVWRWRRRMGQQGVAGLGPDRRGPKGPSRLTADLVAEIVDRRGRGESLRTIAAAVEVCVDSVRRALGEDRAGAGEQLSRPVESAETADDPDSADLEPEADPVLPVLADPDDRSAERAAARWGLLEHADPVFTPAARVPLAGLLLALPGLEATGLLACARQTYQALPAGFYGLDTVLVEAVLRCLAGEPRAEGATRLDPVALGRVLGLDRAPEVKTIRRRLGQLAQANKAEELVAGMARHRLQRTQQTDPEVAAVLYVDGHVRAYHGTRKIAKTHSARLRFPAPATVETWVSDAAGDPVLVIMAEPGASLASELRRLLPHLRQAVGDDRRVLVGFDRGGWSPTLFADMAAAGFDVLTWRKGHADDVADEAFTDISYTDEHGRTHTWTVAETTVDLRLGGTDEADVLPIRQVTRRDAPAGRQLHILTTRTDLSTGEVIYRMGSRWRQENYFRYARIHFDLDSHDCYAAGVDDPDRSVPNPAKKTAHKAVLAARARYDSARARGDEDLLALRSPTPGKTTVISNATHDQVTAGLRAADADLAHAQAVHRDTPARLPLRDVSPGQQMLDTETKLLTHAIRIAAFNTATALARAVRVHTGYARADDEAHTLIRQLLTHTGDIDPTVDGVLTVRLDPMPTRRATVAVAELCEHLTQAETRYPGTDLRLRYEVESRR
ncbi:MAG: helix-turn-helix domain-containing protein [Actinophytocola sp.]|nr:helix-turn-helix domain-containing protein [Actinophytocola sp.]